MTRKEMLEKAKRDYPVGTVFISKISGIKFTVVGIPHYNTQSDLILADTLEPNTAGTKKGRIFGDEEWAKIVSRPEVEKPSKDKPFYVVVTEENKDVLSKWRFENSTSSLEVGEVTGLWGDIGRTLSKEHNRISANNKGFGNEITFEQFLDLYPEYKESVKAEIVSLPEPKYVSPSEPVESNLEKANRMFKVGMTIKTPSFGSRKTLTDSHFPFKVGIDGDIYTKGGQLELYNSKRDKWATIESTPQEYNVHHLTPCSTMYIPIKENTSELIDINFDIPIVIGE
jgi:hypothetical protein